MSAQEIMRYRGLLLHQWFAMFLFVGGVLNVFNPSLFFDWQAATYENTVDIIVLGNSESLSDLGKRLKVSEPEKTSWSVKLSSFITVLICSLCVILFSCIVQHVNTKMLSENKGGGQSAGLPVHEFDMIYYMGFSFTLIGLICACFSLLSLTSYAGTPVVLNVSNVVFNFMLALVTTLIGVVMRAWVVSSSNHAAHASKSSAKKTSIVRV